MCVMRAAGRQRLCGARAPDAHDARRFHGQAARRAPSRLPDAATQARRPEGRRACARRGGCTAKVAPAAKRAHPAQAHGRARRSAQGRPSSRPLGCPDGSAGLGATTRSEQGRQPRSGKSGSCWQGNHRGGPGIACAQGVLGAACVGPRFRVSPSQRRVVVGFDEDASAEVRPAADRREGAAAREVGAGRRRWLGCRKWRVEQLSRRRLDSWAEQPQRSQRNCSGCRHPPVRLSHGPTPTPPVVDWRPFSSSTTDKHTPPGALGKAGSKNPPKKRRPASLLGRLFARASNAPATVGPISG